MMPGGANVTGGVQIIPRGQISGCNASGLLIAVGIATAGRRETLNETLRELAKQTRLPDLVVICPASPNDVDLQFLASLHYRVKVTAGGRGLTRQRNAILRETVGLDAIVFFDDDFFPSPNYLANAEAILRSHRDIVAMSGTPIADGICGPGLAPQEARELIAEAPPMETGAIPGDYGTYGCNMVFRLAPIFEHGIVFDESLPMYGWQEDIDFSRQLAPWGRIVRAQALSGVHLGAKRGRTSGVKFGYSQVANPVYLIRKGTVSLSFGAKTVMRNLAANFLRVCRAESYVDRAGRLRGNILALRDLLRGQLDPGRILELD